MAREINLANPYPGDKMASLTGQSIYRTVGARR